jgi:hypothetical protein
MDSIGSTWATMKGFCEHGNEPSGFINGGDFLEQLRND